MSDLSSGDCVKRSAPGVNPEVGEPRTRDIGTPVKSGDRTPLPTMTFDPQAVQARLDADYRPPVIHATHNPFPPRNWYQAKADLTAALTEIERLERELFAAQQAALKEGIERGWLEQEVVYLKTSLNEAVQLATARVALEDIRDHTFVDADPPELRAQNECTHRRARQALTSLARIAELETVDTHQVELTMTERDHALARIVELEQERDALLHERDGYRERYQFLTTFYDAHEGTPCEQVRHAQQVEQWKQEVERLTTELQAMKDYY